MELALDGCTRNTVFMCEHVTLCGLICGIIMIRVNHVVNVQISSSIHVLYRKTTVLGTSNLSWNTELF